MEIEEFEREFDNAIQESRSDFPRVTVELKTGERLVATRYRIADFGAIVFVKLETEGPDSKKYVSRVLMDSIASIYTYD